MPKMKTNRTAYKKYRVGKKGTIKHGRTNTSHNTGKKASKRMRQLSGTTVVDKTKVDMIQRMLPYGGR